MTRPAGAWHGCTGHGERAMAGQRRADRRSVREKKGTTGKPRLAAPGPPVHLSGASAKQTRLDWPRLPIEFPSPAPHESSAVSLAWSPGSSYPFRNISPYAHPICALHGALPGQRGPSRELHRPPEVLHLPPTSGPQPGQRRPPPHQAEGICSLRGPPPSPAPVSVEAGRGCGGAGRQPRAGRRGA